MRLQYFFALIKVLESHHTMAYKSFTSSYMSPQITFHVSLQWNWPNMWRWVDIIVEKSKFCSYKNLYRCDCGLTKNARSPGEKMWGLNLWQVGKTLKGHWKTTKGIYSHFYWILRCWLLRKLNSAIGKIRVARFLGRQSHPCYSAQQCAKDVVDSFVLATGYKKLVLLTALAALSKKSQFASKCTDTPHTIHPVQRMKSVVMNDMLCQSTFPPCQYIYTSGARSDYTVEMSVCLNLVLCSQ